MRLSGKEAEIAILKAELLIAQHEGPGSSVVQALERDNAELKAKITTLQEKAIIDNDVPISKTLPAKTYCFLRLSTTSYMLTLSSPLA